MADLPDELATAVLFHLRRIDLYQMMLASKRWNSLANDNSVWKAKCKEMDIEIPADLRGQIGGVKRAFVRRMRVEENWRRGQIKTIVSRC